MQHLNQGSEDFNRNEFIIDFYEKLIESNTLAGSSNEIIKGFHPINHSASSKSVPLGYFAETEEESSLGLDFDLQVNDEN